MKWPSVFGGLRHPGWLLVYFVPFGFVLHTPWSPVTAPKEAQIKLLGFSLHWFKKPKDVKA
ncbi:MAG: hypothetical protein O9320_08645 [Magnetospirillum sp.]|nr:hypothetical protein [Magnetospirillum sp.]